MTLCDKVNHAVASLCIGLHVYPVWYGILEFNVPLDTV